MKPQIMEEVPVTLAVLKHELEAIKKKDSELNFRANKTEEYLNQFEVQTVKKAEEQAKKLKGLEIPRLKEEHIVKIIDVQPKNVNQLKTILQGYPININNENLKKIVDNL